MNKNLKAVLLAAVCAAAVSSAVYFTKQSAPNYPENKQNVSNFKRAVQPQVHADNDLESLTDSLGKFVDRAEAGKLEFTEDTAAFRTLWQDLTPLMILENQIRRGKGSINALQYAESRHIYSFLFEGDAEKIKRSYGNLKKSLCFERLARLGPEYFRGADFSRQDKMRCPASEKAYEVTDSGLACPYHDMTYLKADRRFINAPDEIYRQLAMGYYNSARLHRLDNVILGKGLSAVRPGEIVADVGCGSGCYSWSMASGAAPDGKVIALDVDKSVLEFINYTAGLRKSSAVETKLVSHTDPGLAENSLDRIYMIDILNVMIGMNMHDGVPVIPETEEYIKKLIKALKPGGFLVIADFYPYRDCPHVSPEQAEAFMKKFGLEKAEQIEACSAPSAMYAVTFCRTGGSL